MTYNLTFMESSTNFVEVMTGVNAGNSLLGALFLLTVAIVMFIALKNFDSKTVFLVSTFVTSVVGMFLFTLGWISISIFIIPVVLMFISIFYVIAVK